MILGKHHPAKLMVTDPENHSKPIHSDLLPLYPNGSCEGSSVAEIKAPFFQSQRVKRRFNTFPHVLTATTKYTYQLQILQLLPRKSRNFCVSNPLWSRASSGILPWSWSSPPVICSLAARDCREPPGTSGNMTP